MSCEQLRRESPAVACGFVTNILSILTILRIPTACAQGKVLRIPTACAQGKVPRIPTDCAQVKVLRIPTACAQGKVPRMLYRDMLLQSHAVFVTKCLTVGEGSRGAPRGRTRRRRTGCPPFRMPSVHWLHETHRQHWLLLSFPRQARALVARRPSRVSYERDKRNAVSSSLGVVPLRA